MLRRTTFVAMGLLLACAGTLVSTPVAHAASYAGDLRVKGPGSTAYHQGYYNSLVGNEGATLTWTFQVVNTGSTLAQFNVQVLDTNTTAPLELYDGSLFVKPLASSPDGYFTKALAPGASQVLTAKMKIPAGAGYHYVSLLRLRPVDNRDFVLDEVAMMGEQAAQAAAQPHSLAVKSGGQPYAGNGFNYEVVTAGTITPTGTATFTAVVKNGGSSPSSTYFHVDGQGVFGCGNFTVTVKQGTKNVTAQATAGTYSTGVLAPGASRTLSISIRALGRAPNCDFDAWQAGTSSSPGTFSSSVTSLVVNIAAA